MNTNMKNQNKISFLEVYLNNISPKLKEIDIMLKSTNGKISINRVAKTLSISTEEILSIMDKLGINEIDSPSFIKIMACGSSEICAIFKREVECGSPYTYSRQDISYIYNLDLSTVNYVCDTLNIIEATAYTLPEIFAEIRI